MYFNLNELNERSDVNVYNEINDTAGCLIVQSDRDVPQPNTVADLQQQKGEPHFHRLQADLCFIYRVPSMPLWFCVFRSSGW